MVHIFRIKCNNINEAVSRISFETISVESGSSKRVCHTNKSVHVKITTGKKVNNEWREREKNLIITTNSGEPVPERVYSISKRKLMCRFYLGDGSKIR